MISLTIDNQRVEIEEGTKLLGAIEKQGIKIPTLCHHKALTPYGACRLCIVEIHTPGRQPAIHASCSYPVQEGMVVFTNTGRVKNARKIVAELLLARCPDSDVIQRIALEHGVTKPRITVKNDDCIYCGLCVRMCEERMGRSAIGFTGRGSRKKLEPPFGMHNDRCWACGACDFICPVGKKIRTLTSRNVPVPILDSYNLGLNNRSVAHILYPQAVPNFPVIDREHCVHLNDDACGICEDLCGPKAINFNQKDTNVDVNVGAIVLAPGFEAFDPSVKKELNYGTSPNVVTALQFERILSPSGPYAGKVLRPSDLKAPKRIAFIQCVGSREKEWDFCSAVCCMYATKEALIAKEHAGQDLGCDIFFIDIRAYSKGFESYFETAKKHDVNYIRCRIPRVEVIPESQNLSITYLGQADRKETREYDMVVLSVGLHPPKNVEHLAETFGIELDSNHFCKTSTFAPVETTREGVYAVGPFIEPKDIPETVVQASAAAAKALSLLGDARGSLIIPKKYPPETNTKDQEPRVGVFVCKCGTNIAGFLSVPDVTAYAKTLPNVVYADHSLYTCSNDIQEKMKQVIAEHKLNRVVVASCTPRTHEPLFKNTIREAGLNPYLFEMANIRNQCSWVHMHEPAKATAKAKDLVRMAVAKVRLNESLYTRPLDVVHGALVIGGGLAGMTAALEIAEQGFNVALVEKEPVLGGFMKRVYYLLGGDDPQEKLSNLISRVETHTNIKVYTNATMKEVKGSLGNFESKISIAGYDNPVSVNHGVIVVATGSDPYIPAEYLYGKDNRVLLNEQFEEQLALNDFNGKSVAFIQCVGSRQPDRPYCSRTCCSESVKHALQLKKMSPETQVYILYRELRTFGFREAYYTRARALGVTFIRFPDDQLPIVMGHNGKLSIDVVAATINEKLRLLVDNVVLAAATIPRQDSKELAQVLKVPLSEDNFFLEAHRKLRPVDFSTDGIFLCGNAYAPFGVAETIAQGLATSARAATILANKQIDLEPTISHVVEENCDGCAYCIDPCPFKAITLVEYEVNGEKKKRVQVAESVCKGCGTCMATCPKKAIFVWHFRPEQLSAEVKAALEVPV
jgi:heterodisulfide reductase subunit A